MNLMCNVSNTVIKSLYKLTVQHLHMLFCSTPWVLIKFWLVMDKNYSVSANEMPVSGK